VFPLNQGSWLTEGIALFLGPFIHEDISIVSAAFLVVEHGLPFIPALACLYGGIVASDLAIYGLGAIARRLGLARRLLIGPKVDRARQRLSENLTLSVAMCRLLPGLLFPTFLACGWFGLSFVRFTAVTMITAAVYTPLMLMLAVKLGETVFRRIGSWTWIVPLSALALITFLRMRRKNSRAAAAVLSSESHPLGENPPEIMSHRGMPSLDLLARKVLPAERIPQIIFYAPIFMAWMVLGWRYRSLTLPTISNPLIEAGGLWGESKSRLLRQVPNDQQHWIAPFVTITTGNNSEDVNKDLIEALDTMAACRLGFPVVAKPDEGFQGYGVRLLPDREALLAYLVSFPKGYTVILQQPINHDGEAGVFYGRLPGEKSGRILSLTFRYFPHVIGDGVSTVGTLIAQDPRTRFKKHFYLGSNARHLGANGERFETIPAVGEVVRLSFIGSIRVGGLYRNACSLITPAMTERFDAIARDIPEFYFGRFDIRFKSQELLQSGDGFSIIEINGAGSEPIHVWDPETSMIEAYREEIRFLSMSFEIGNRNRLRGFKPMSVISLLKYTRNYNRLLTLYPPSG